MEYTDIQFWISFFEIVLLNLILSGDNAVVIGMAARNLPAEQRRKVIMMGAGVAILLRVMLTAVASYLLHIPFLMTIGGLLLLWIAIKLLIDDEKNHYVNAGKSLRSAVKTIVMADVVMSLDNVLAIAGAAHGNLFLILFGLGLSIPIIMWGSKLVAMLMKKLPWLVYIGSALLGYTAGDLFINDPTFKLYFDEQHLLVILIPYIFIIFPIITGLIFRKTTRPKENNLNI